MSLGVLGAIEQTITTYQLALELGTSDGGNTEGKESGRDPWASAGAEGAVGP